MTNLQLPKYIDIVGKSGKTYKLISHDLNTDLPSYTGVYIFAKVYIEQTSVKHDLIYCGKSVNISARFGDHHKHECIVDNGCNSLFLLKTVDEDTALSVEKDILLNNDFKCNEKLN